jgi:hypothetical protein
LLTRGLRASLWLALAAAGAGAAGAANLTDLRVGVHGDHTRIVLETDAAAPYIVDSNEREVIVHVDAAAAAEAVTAKSPHLIWAKVEPTPIGADVRISLKQPADVKAMVLTNPHRIVLDLYPRKGASKPLPAAEPLPAPELLPEPEPPVTAEAEPGLPEELPEPTPEELAEAGVGEEVEPEVPSRGSEAEAPSGVEEPEEAPAAEPEAPLAGGRETQEPGEREGAPTPAPEPDALAGEPMELRVPLPSPGQPPKPAPEPPSGGLFGSPYVLGAFALVLFGLFVFLRRRLRRPERFHYPEEPEEEPVPYEPPQRAVPIEAPAGVGESLFDVEADVVNAIPRDEEPVPRPVPADADSGDETQRRMAHLERRIEELVDARERLERQVAAQTEELRVQRAAIARTQRVLRTVAPRTDEESSEPVVRG